MSSHHIVRENQEPALLVTAGQALDNELLGQLLEWSPAVITDTCNVDYLLALGIKVDVVFGEKPSHIIQDSIQFINLSQADDLIDKAFSYLLDNRFKAVNIISSTISPKLKLYAGQLDIVSFCEGIRYAFFRSKYEKWKPKGEKIYLDEGHIKTFLGVDHIAKGEFITTTDGFVTVEFSIDDYVLVGEEL